MIDCLPTSTFSRLSIERLSRFRHRQAGGEGARKLVQRERGRLGLAAVSARSPTMERAVL